MRYSVLTLAAAITAVTAQADCQAKYKQCIADGWAEVKCSCDLTSCSGEDAARIRDYCATATANLQPPAKTTNSPPTGTPINAPDGSLPLGALCSDKKQCSNGADCWGSSQGIIRRCGNFNGNCKDDSQCAYNTCNPSTHLCSGFLPSESFKANTASQTVTAAPSSTFACNPAHEYPEGRKCVSTNGGLTLLPPTTAAATSTGFPCNPAHAYPGQVCTEINGGLTLVPTATSGPVATSTGFPCNPAHAYPGQVCTEINGGLTLVQTATSGPAATSTGFPCNPAHAYPGKVCAQINGQLTLVAAAPTTAAATATATSGPGYACNPAHDYGNGQVCAEINGQLTLVLAAPTHAASPPVYGPGNNTSVVPTGTGAVNPTGSVTPFTGSASVVEALSGLAALVAGVVAYVL